jgi:hypothetical protein
LVAFVRTHAQIEQFRAHNIIRIVDSYKGIGYAIATRTEMELIKLVANSSGVILDPVYTAKAVNGMLHDFAADNQRKRPKTGGDCDDDTESKERTIHDNTTSTSTTTTSTTTTTTTDEPIFNCSSEQILFVHTGGAFSNYGYLPQMQQSGIFNTSDTIHHLIQ